LETTHALLFGQAAGHLSGVRYCTKGGALLTRHKPDFASVHAIEQFKLEDAIMQHQLLAVMKASIGQKKAFTIFSKRRAQLPQIPKTMNYLQKHR